MRAAYGCDCDGVSHLKTSLLLQPRHAASIAGVRSMRRMVKETTGIEPESCPWRAFYHPLVAEILDAAALASEGALSVRTSDPPAILADGLALYIRCRNATTGHFMRQRIKELKAKQRK